MATWDKPRSRRTARGRKQEAADILPPTHVTARMVFVHQEIALQQDWEESMMNVDVMV